ncbi:MAG: hypothetical protein ACREHF_02130 [Rhizomicrobium sp.]
MSNENAKKPTSRPSNRILVDEHGVRERVDVDLEPGADNSRAHGYDNAGGRAFNERFRQKNNTPKGAR